MNQKTHRGPRAWVRGAGATALLASLLVAPPAWAADTDVATFAELVAAIETANASPGPDSITITAPITLEGDLPVITDSLTITGGSIDGADAYRGINVEDAETFTISGVTITNIKSQGLAAKDVGTAVISDVTIDGTSSQGLYIYSNGTTTRITNTVVRNARYDGANIRLFNQAVAEVDGLHVSDSGRLDSSSDPLQTGGLMVSAIHSARADLRNLSYTENDPTRVNDVFLPGITAHANGSAVVKIAGATSTGAGTGAQVTSLGTSSIDVDGLTVNGAQWIGIDAGAYDSSTTVMSNTAASDTISSGIEVNAHDTATFELRSAETIATQRDGILVKAEGASTVSLANLAATDSDMSGINVVSADSASVTAEHLNTTDSREEGVVAGTLQNSTVDLIDVSVKGARTGVSLFANGASGLSLEQVVVKNTDWEAILVNSGDDGSVWIDNAEVLGSDDLGLAVHSYDDSTVSVGSFIIANTEGVLGELRGRGDLYLADGLVSNSHGIGGITIQGDARQSTTALLYQVMVEHTPGYGLLVDDVGQADVDAVTVYNAAETGIGYSTASLDHTLNIVNSTVSAVPVGVLVSNTSTDSAPLLRVDSSTIVGSTQDVLKVDREKADIQTRNSIFSGAFSHGDALADSLTSSYSLWDGVSGALESSLTGSGNLVNVDPLLEPLADSGGITKTHMLGDDSPAIDAGDPDAALYGPVIDQIGNARIVETIDMGSVEFGTRDIGGADPGEEPGEEPGTDPGEEPGEPSGTQPPKDLDSLDDLGEHPAGMAETGVDRMSGLGMLAFGFVTIGLILARIRHSSAVR